MARRAFVRGEVQRVAGGGRAGDVVGVPGDLAPRRVRPGHARRRRDVERDLVLHAVRDRRDGPARARRDGHERRVFGRERDPRAHVVAEDRGIALGIRSEHVQPRDALGVLLALGLVRGGLGRAEIVERAPVVAPRRRHVDGALDDVGQQPSGARVEHVQHGLLRAALRRSERDVPPIGRGRVVVERVVLFRRAREAVGIEHDALGAARDRARVQPRGVGAGRALLVEVHAADGLHVGERLRRVVELRDALRQRGAARQPVEHRARVRALRLEVRREPGVLRVLEIAVRVGHRDAEVRLGHRPHRGRRRSRRRRRQQRERRHQEREAERERTSHPAPLTRG